VSIDAELRTSLASTDICMLKADVEGYEPQAVASGRRLLADNCVLAVQLEVNAEPMFARRQMRDRRAGCDEPTRAEQSERNIAMLEELQQLGYSFRIIDNSVIDSNATVPITGTWRGAHNTWRQLSAFGAPLVHERPRQHNSSLLRASARPPSVRCAYWRLFPDHSYVQSTNLVGLQQRAACKERLPRHLAPR
jgi:hypothetical protein